MNWMSSKDRGATTASFTLLPFRWQAIGSPSLRREVRRLQMRIAKATRASSLGCRQAPQAGVRVTSGIDEEYRPEPTPAAAPDPIGRIGPMTRRKSWPQLSLLPVWDSGSLKWEIEKSRKISFN
jgi:hypothetical protein